MQRNGLCTNGIYNVRAPSTEEKLKELNHEIQNIKWNIIRLDDVRGTKAYLTNLNSRHVLYSKKTETKNLWGRYLAHKILQIRSKLAKICLAEYLM